MGATSSISIPSSPICGVTLTVNASVRTIAGSLLTVTMVGVEIHRHAIVPLRKISHLNQSRLAVDAERRAVRQQRLNAFRDVAEDVALRAGRHFGAAARSAVARDGRLADALVRDVVDVEEARLGRATEDADERAVDGVIQAERAQDESERLTHGDVLQLADERLAEPG